LALPLLRRHFYGEALCSHGIQGFKRAKNKTLFYLSEIINFEKPTFTLHEPPNFPTTNRQ
jgi:hypothetical protein